MKMSHERRVFADFDIKDPEGLEVDLSPSDSKHLRTVLRLSSGSPVTVVEKTSGQSYEAVVVSVDQTDRVQVKLLKSHEMASSRSPVATLIFALCKNPVNDLVCEKAAEMGVDRLIFWQAERSVLKLKGTESSAKIERWLKISESAARQSQKSHIMSVQLATSEAQLFETLNSAVATGDIKLCCSLSKESVALRNLNRPSGRAHLLVGPAGDLTPAEEARLIRDGFARVTLGPCLLRAETAAIAAIASVQAVWG